jgi:hypothetical protein
MPANEQHHLVSTPFGWLLCTRDRYRHNHLPVATLPLHAVPNRRIHAQNPSDRARTTCGRQLTQHTELIYADANEASHVSCNHCLHPEARKPAPPNITGGVDKTKKDRPPRVAGHPS